MSKSFEKRFDRKYQKLKERFQKISKGEIFNMIKKDYEKRYEYLKEFFTKKRQGREYYFTLYYKKMQIHFPDNFDIFVEGEEKEMLYFKYRMTLLDMDEKMIVFDGNWSSDMRYVIQLCTYYDDDSEHEVACSRFLIEKILNSVEGFLKIFDVSISYMTQEDKEIFRNHIKLDDANSLVSGEFFRDYLIEKGMIKKENL